MYFALFSLHRPLRRGLALLKKLGYFPKLYIFLNILAHFAILWINKIFFVIFLFYIFRIVKPAIMLVFDVRPPHAIWRRVGNSLVISDHKSKRPPSLQCISNFGHPGLHIEHCVDCVVLRGVAVFLSDGADWGWCRYVQRAKFP